MKKRYQLAVWLMTAVMAAPVFTGVGAEAAETEIVTEAGDSSSKVASADEMVAPEDVVEEGLEPVYGTDVEDGTYTVEVLSSSSMFNIIDCQLTVEDGQMTAVMTMGGQGYLKIFMGTGEEAAKASEEGFIPYVENEEGQHTFQVPVEALDKGINCAAFSKKKEKWYDRMIVFRSASLPETAVTRKMTLAEDLALADGTYQVEVTLEGGSGRTTVESPAALTVKDGQMTATIVFSSPNYDYVLVGEEKYLQTNTEGNSTFEIPVQGMDYKMPLVGDTVAMSEPHEIDYTLYFDSASIVEAN